MVSCGTFQKLRPLSLLAHLSSCYDSAQLKVMSGSVSWSIYLERGKITYASHSIAAFDRLDCHLRRLSYRTPTLTSETRAQLRLLFETDPESQSMSNPDYQAICWLVDHQYLNSALALELISGIVKEVIESFLLVKAGTYELGNNYLQDSPTFCQLGLEPLVEECQKKLEGWKSLSPQIWSPYQRPYFANRPRTQLSPEINQRLSTLLRGFSLRHLAILLNQDELLLAQSLHPYIVDGTILLQDPYPPFDQLPKTLELPSVNQYPNLGTVYKPPAPISPITANNSTTFSNHKIFSTVQGLPSSSHAEKIVPHQQKDLENNKLLKFTTPGNSSSTHSTNPPSDSTAATPAEQNIYKVVCVDDSPTMLRELNYFLEDESFSVFTISDSVKALMQIIRIKPDLILLDVKMSGIDGYELCRLLRNHSLFKNTPIIMVTGNTGIIDRVKARLVGASGYLTKPFTQSDLLKLIFRHLS